MEIPVKLIGRNYSPFVRRVATTLTLLEIPFEHQQLSVITDRDTIKGYSPLGRVPALVLDDGETLIDSAAILDAIDGMVGPERALVPASGAERRAVLKLVALAVGACEKMVTAYYERTRRPAQFLYEDWAAQCEDQARAALTVLDQAAAAATPLSGGRLTQADVSAVIAYDFACLTQKDQLTPERSFPALAAYSARLNALPAFATTQAT